MPASPAVPIGVGLKESLVEAFKGAIKEGVGGLNQPPSQISLGVDFKESLAGAFRAIQPPSISLGDSVKESLESIAESGNERLEIERKRLHIEQQRLEIQREG